MFRTTTLLAGVVLSCGLAACGGSEVKSDARPVSERAGSSPGGAPTGAAPRSHLNRRLMFYEAQTGIPFIVVGETHSWRRTPEGRVRLALGRPDVGYEVLSEKSIDALLQSMDNLGLSRYATTFEKGDEDYFERRFRDTRFRGIIYVEEGERRRKVLCFRPHGPDDVDGHERLRNYIGLKGLIFKWYNSHPESEVPASGSTISGRRP